ncbi:MAG: SDR family NAD(P)-dependent oxidoreductase [Actinobacteria bacterium]|nr:SDR family NAD(P)-dependent oxidoreductase [Actinomycetota bacterium]
MDVKGRIFLVAGGGSGLGGATAHLLAKDGANVVVADLDKGETAGDSIRFVETNVTDEGSVKGAIDVALQDFGGLHGAINCAGIASAEKVLGREGPHSLKSFSKVVEVNLIGTFNVLRLAAEAMAKNEPTEGGERGVIVNTASVAAFDGQIGQVAYAASKGGVAAMTLPVARELARHGIRVVAIAPGIFDTPMLAVLPEAARKSLGKQALFPQRLGRPEEFAALVRHPELVVPVFRLCGQGPYLVLPAPPQVKRQPHAGQTHDPHERPGPSRPARQKRGHAKVGRPL